LSPIIKFIKDIAIPRVKIIAKLKFLSSIPCNVDKTFQMDIRENKKIDEIKQYNIRLLIFISSPS
jgi:hypothetical protein